MSIIQIGFYKYFFFATLLIQTIRMNMIKHVIFVILFACSFALTGRGQTEAELIQLVEQNRAEGNLMVSASNLNKLAIHYWQEEKLEKALQCFEQSVSLNMEIGNNNAIKVIYSNMGTIYSDMGQMETALVFFRKSLLISQSQANKKDIATTLINIGTTLMYLNRIEESIENLNESLPLLLELQNKNLLKSGYQLLAEAHQMIGNSQKSMEYMNLYTAFQNEIQREMLEASQNQSKEAVEKAEQETKKVKEEKKQTEQKLSITQDSLKVSEELNRLKEMEIQKKQAELKSQQLLTLIFIIGMGFIAVVAMLILRSNQQKKRHNKILEHRNEEIRKQNEEIKAQNVKINQSIKYARNIQGALLPDIHQFKELFAESFIYFSPRDVVSGDFYWFGSVPGNNQLKIVAAIDCTGHGVPGAFMSMLGMSFMEEIVFEKKIFEPKEILENLHLLIKTALKQETTGNSDGMDAAICVYDQQTKILKFAGAVNSMILISKGEVTTFKGDFFGIGGTMKGQPPNERMFSQHEIKIQGDEYCYIFTDGFIDQFGGPHGKKYFMKNFQKLIHSIHQMPFDIQHIKLEEALNDWMGSSNQRVDDVLVIGFKL